MPWPKDPTPVRAEESGDGRWHVVSKDGVRLPGTGTASQAEAEAEAKRINETWARAKKERDIREAAQVDGDVRAVVSARARELALEERLRQWDPIEHPRGRLGQFIDKLLSGREHPRSRGKQNYVARGIPSGPGNPIYVTREQYSAALARIIAELRAEANKRGGLDAWEQGRLKGLAAARRIVQRYENWTEIARVARAWKSSGDEDYDDGFQTGMRTAYLLHDELKAENARNRLWDRPRERAA